VHESRIRSTVVTGDKPFSEPTAVVALRGEHDLSGNAELSAALERACGQTRVLVDLTRCEFADSTVLALLLAVHRKQVGRGKRLELVLPSCPHPLQRITSLARVGTLMTVHETRSAALSTPRD
jgi:anti-anti-sigma factor